jgi:hypothetical protein
MRVQMRQRVRSRRRARWPTVVALFVGALLAFVPIADAFCAIDLPLADPPASSTSTGDTDQAPGGHDPDPCCEHAASLLAVSDCKADDLGAGTVRSFDRPLALAAPVFQPAFSTLPRARIRIDVPPAPEPLFRRLKRLLI